VNSEVEAMEDDAIASENGNKSPTKPKTYRFREFLVKWLGKSHWKNSWIPEIRVSLILILLVLYETLLSTVVCVPANHPSSVHASSQHGDPSLTRAPSSRTEEAQTTIHCLSHGRRPRGTGDDATECWDQAPVVTDTQNHQ